MYNFFKLNKSNHIATVLFERTDLEMNILSASVLNELSSVLDAVAGDKSIKGLVFSSGKADQFIVGADIADIQSLTSSESARDGSQAMQKVLTKFEQLNIPTVAAIHGTCLGGGLELSLCCTWRIVSNSEKTILGLPEIQLGFIPGAGGTQRLPRLVGIQNGLDLILTGKRIDGAKAFKIGLADALVHPSLLHAEALKLAEKKRGQTNERKIAAAEWALERNFVGRRVMRQKAKSVVDKNTKGHYPAPYKALEAVFDGFETSLENGLKLEATLFGGLVQTKESKALIHVFHATNAIKKHPYKKSGLERFGGEKTSRVGVIGGGFMGGGIATVCADKNIMAVVSDPNKDSLGRTLKSARSFFAKKVKRRKLKQFQAESKLNSIVPQLNPTGFNRLDIVIEAVFEDLALKQKILAGVERDCHKNWIFASNTSALPIADIAAKSNSPERVLGMHFFSPVEKMPLLEIVTTEKTAPWATARAIELGNSMGKTVIVVKDSPGFYTTRVLAFYLAEAALLLGEGCSIEYLDRVLTDFGWPVGPITLIDEVGIDVGIHVMETMTKAWPKRFSSSPHFFTIKESGRLGRKNSKGFYRYEGGKKADVDSEIYRIIGTSPSESTSRQDVIDRCVLGYINESARCLEEGILPSAYEGDIGSVFGLGFPPFLGGPFKYVDSLGVKSVVDTLKKLEERFGARFAPCEKLKSMAAAGQLFFTDENN